jgi:hypothetical protein
MDFKVKEKLRLGFMERCILTQNAISVFSNDN